MDDISADARTIKQLSLSKAEVLPGADGPLLLDGMTELPSDVAKAFARHKGTLSLGGLVELSDAIIPLPTLILFQYILEEAAE